MGNPLVRYLLGDNNIYDVDFQCISRDRSTVRLDQVILPGKVKEKVLKLAENYSSNRSKKARALVDEFYGYGTGLIFLFHGPSGTGKTMLAHARKNRDEKEPSADKEESQTTTDDDKRDPFLCHRPFVVNS